MSAREVAPAASPAVAAMTRYAESTGAITDPGLKELYRIATDLYAELNVAQAELAQRGDDLRAKVLIEEANAIVAHCPWHSDNNYTWPDCHCPVADEMRRRASALVSARAERVGVVS